MLTAKEIVERCEKLGLSDETVERLLGKNDPENDTESFTLLTTHENIDDELTVKLMALSKNEKLLLYNALRLLERPGASFTMEVDWPNCWGGIYDYGETVNISFNISARLGKKPPDEDEEEKAGRGPEQQPECCRLNEDCDNNKCRWYDSINWLKDD